MFRLFAFLLLLVPLTYGGLWLADNPGMVKVLFICGKARMRSPTAADLVAKWSGVESDFAGLSNDADEKLSAEQIAWADQIFVMERRQLARLKSMFGRELRDKRVRSLNIPDRYKYMEPALVERLEAQLAGLFRT